MIGGLMTSLTFVTCVIVVLSGQEVVGQGGQEFTNSHLAPRNRGGFVRSPEGVVGGAPSVGSVQREQSPPAVVRGPLRRRPQVSLPIRRLSVRDRIRGQDVTEEANIETTETPKTQSQLFAEEKQRRDEELERRVQEQVVRDEALAKHQLLIAEELQRRNEELERRAQEQIVRGELMIKTKQVAAVTAEPQLEDVIEEATTETTETPKTHAQLIAEEKQRRDEELERRVQEQVVRDEALAKYQLVIDAESQRRAEELERRAQEQIVRDDLVKKGEQLIAEELQRRNEELERRAQEQIVRDELVIKTKQLIDEETQRRDEELERRAQEQLVRDAELKIREKQALEAPLKLTPHAKLVADELERRAQEQLARDAELNRREEEQVLRDEELARRAEHDKLVMEDLERRKAAEEVLAALMAVTETTREHVEAKHTVISRKRGGSQTLEQVDPIILSSRPLRTRSRGGSQGPRLHRHETTAPGDFRKKRHQDATVDGIVLRKEEETKKHEKNLSRKEAIETKQSESGVAHEIAGKTQHEQQAHQLELINIEKAEIIKKLEMKRQKLEEERLKKEEIRKSVEMKRLGLEPGQISQNENTHEEIAAKKQEEANIHQENLSRKEEIEIKQLETGLAHQAVGKTQHEQEAHQHELINRERDELIKKLEAQRKVIEDERVRKEEIRKSVEFERMQREQEQIIQSENQKRGLAAAQRHEASAIHSLEDGTSGAVIQAPSFLCSLTAMLILLLSF